MSRMLAVAAAVLLAAPSAGAQPVEVAPLAAPDAFSTPGRPTGLGQDLWRGASADTVQAVLPMLAQRPLSPAAAALARRVLATGAPGPQGARTDSALLAGRANALAALGDVGSAAAILERAPGLDRNAELSHAAAESALLAGDDARACAVAQALSAGRDDAYWLRLRTYCEAIAGRAGPAQLTFDLAQAQAQDPVFARLMGAKLANSATPGGASLRNGLDYALSRSLGLDLSTAKPAPAVAAAIAGGAPAEPAWSLPPGDAPVAVATRAIAAGGPLPADLLPRLLDAAAQAAPKAKPAAEAAVLLAAAVAGSPGPEVRARLAAIALPEARTSAGRNLALETAAADKLAGEAAMLALWICAEAGPGSLAPAERARIIRALRAVGLEADARNFAVEGLLALA